MIARVLKKLFLKRFSAFITVMCRLGAERGGALGMEAMVEVSSGMVDLLVGGDRN